MGYGSQVRRHQLEKHLVARRSHSECNLFHNYPKCHWKCLNFQRAEVPQRSIMCSPDIFLFISLLIIIFSLECVYTSQFHRTKREYCKCTALSNQQSVSPETPDVHVQMTVTIMGISFQGTKRARLMSQVSMEGGAMYNIKNT